MTIIPSERRAVNLFICHFDRVRGLSKAALAVVTSVLCDRHRKNKTKKATIADEIVSFI